MVYKIGGQENFTVLWVIKLNGFDLIVYNFRLNSFSNLSVLNKLNRFRADKT